MNQRSPAAPTAGAPTTPSTATDHTIFALLQAAHALEAKVEAALETAGLSSPKFSVLSELVAAGQPLPLSELATRLSCVRSNMTQLVDRLEADGLVQRVACPNDRRSVKAEITYAGRERQRAGAAAVARLHEAFAAAVPAADRAALGRMLAALG
jgi:DNA-binding MarR family transcriptional regulator